MPPNRKRLYQGSYLQGHIVRQLLDILNRGTSILSHAATPTRQTNKAKGIARVRQTFSTRSTAPVVDRRLDTHFIARFETRDAFADFVDHGAEFVSEGYWRAFPSHAMRLPFKRDDMWSVEVFVKVAAKMLALRIGKLGVLAGCLPAADACESGLYSNPAWFDFWDRYFVDTNVFGSVETDCFHCFAHLGERSFCLLKSFSSCFPCSCWFSLTRDEKTS